MLEKNVYDEKWNEHTNSYNKTDHAEVTVWLISCTKFNNANENKVGKSIKAEQQRF